VLKKPGTWLRRSALQDDLSTSVDAVQLEDVLRDIKADGDNLRHRRDPLRFLDMPILARPKLVEGAIHDITLTGNTARYSSRKNLALREINGLGCARNDLVGLPNGYTQLM